MALKQYKPNTPGQRGLVLVDNSSLHKGKPLKKLTNLERNQIDNDIELWNKKINYLLENLDLRDQLLFNAQKRIGLLKR